MWVGDDWATSLSLFSFHALEKEMASHSSVLAWRTPGMGEPAGLLSVGLHRVGHDWSHLAAAAAVDMKWHFLVVLICVSLTTSGAERLFRFSWAICVSLWRNVCLVLWPIFWLGRLFFWYWAAGAACIFWRLILCQLFHLLSFSPILKAVFSPCL